MPPKTIRGRPKIKVVVVEPIDEPVYHEREPEQELEPELELEQEPEPEPNFLSELNNQNYNRVPTETMYLEEPDEPDEPDNIQYEIVEGPEYQEMDDEPDQASIDMINHLRERRSEPEPRPRQSRTKSDDDEIFSKNGTEILGETKLLLINKITQYKNLFKTELKTFKIKKNATEEELETYIEEMNCIISISSIDIFISDSILQTLKMIEGVSMYNNKYDVSGLSDILKQNPQFHNLIKQLYLRYNVFTKVPPEAQLALLVITTGYVCNQQNRRKKSDFLNKPFIPPVV